MAYLTLMIAAFLAATLLPFSSEALLSGYMLAGYSALGLWAAASVGNTLGSAVNWWLGYHLLRWQERAWFPVSPEKLQRAQLRFNRYGRWSLLFAWVPVVGDPLTFLAGTMRVPFGLFIVLVGTGKALRYAVIIYLVEMLK